MRLPKRLLRRKIRAHKGDFGHVLVVAGSLQYSGAAALCSLSALRSGAGLVTAALPQRLAKIFISFKPFEAMFLPLTDTGAFKQIKQAAERVDVLALGPGLGRERKTFLLVERIVSGIQKKMVIDADGLNALVKCKAYLRKHPADEIVLTPHAGEFQRLSPGAVIETDRQRKSAALEFARKFGVVMVLKGAQTVVADSGGRVYVNSTGNPGMATAGSGDVLTGMIAAFMALGLESFEAAKFAVYLHGRAGDLAAAKKTQISLIASDIIDKIPEALKGAV